MGSPSEDRNPRRHLLADKRAEDRNPSQKIEIPLEHNYNIKEVKEDRNPSCNTIIWHTSEEVIYLLTSLPEDRNPCYRTEVKEVCSQDRRSHLFVDV